ncbi:MAG: twin-arginine translocase TatA/TatE family subunit [Bdellovibrionota bacterium]
MLSIWHVLLFLIIVVIIFGPSRLEQLGPSLGRAIRGFKEGLNGELEGTAKKTPTETASTDVSSHPENKI